MSFRFAFGIWYLENAWFNQENIERRPHKRGNQCRKCAFFSSHCPIILKWTNMKRVCYHNNGIECDKNNQGADAVLMLVFSQDEKWINVIKLYKQYQANLQRSFTCNIQGDRSKRLHVSPCIVYTVYSNMQWIAFAYFMWSLLCDGAVCSFLTAHSIAPVIFLWKRIFLDFYSVLFYAVIADAERHFFNDIFFYAAGILKTLVTTIVVAVAAVNWGCVKRGKMP